MPQNHQLSRKLFSKENAELGSHARNSQEIFNRIPVQVHKTLEALYAEPLVLGGLLEEPFEIKLARIVAVSSPETPVLACTGFLHWIWKPQSGGALIQNITGLTVATNGQTRYRFSFRITYRME